MFSITNIFNPLTGGAVTEEFTRESGKPLSDYVGHDAECVVSCNGDVVELPLSDIFPAENEKYTIMVIPEGGDKQTWKIIGTIALAAAVFGIPGAPFLTPWLKGISAATKSKAWLIGAGLINLFLRDDLPKDQSASQSHSWQHVSSPTAAHGNAMPVIYGKVRVRPILKNRYVVIEGDKQRLYALYGIAAHKVDERNIPAWGQQTSPNHRIGDEVSTIPQAYEPGKTYICKSDHHVFDDRTKDGDRITLASEEFWEEGHGTASFFNDITINGRVIGDYGADVDWATRPGLAEQMWMEGFDVTYANISLDVVLHLNFPTINKDVANLGTSFSIEHGFRIGWDRHVMMLRSTAYEILSKHKGMTPNVPNYIYFDFEQDTDTYYVTTVEPTGASQYVVDIDGSGLYYTRVPTDDDWFSPVQPLTNAHNIELMFEFPNGLYGQKAGGDMVKAECRLFAQYRAFGTDKWYSFNFATFEGDITDHVRREDRLDPSGRTKSHTTGILSRNKPTPFNVSVKARVKGEPLDPNETYEVRVTANSSCVVKLVNVATIVYGEKNADGTTPGFTYPGEPLLGIKALASGQLSSDLDVQVDAERSKVWVYDTDVGDWVQKPANNHAWAVYDILAQGHPDHPAYSTYDNDDAEAVYGCGVDYTHIDYTSFAEWADNITRLKYELNIVYDTFMTAWDAILRICQEGRGMVYPMGTKIYAFTDKPVDTAQLFTMGNIHLDTFVQKYLESGQKANMIEATYYDRDNNYNKTTIAARTADWDSDTGLNQPISITLYGTVTFEQAWSIARFLLMGNELLNNVISFGVDIDSLAVQVGQVVEVQHDVLTTGQGGRIVTVTGTPAMGITLTLDRTLTLTAGQNYELKIYHNDGTIETKYPITGGIPTTQIVFGSEWEWDKTPETYELYSFGIRGHHTGSYRVTEISRTTELTRTLTLVQYDERMYGSYNPNDAVSVIGDGYVSKPTVVVSSTAAGEAISILNLASNLKLQEIISKNPTDTGNIIQVAATWDTANNNSRGTWEIWFRDVDESDIDWQGTWRTGEAYNYGAKVELDGVTYISVEDDNVGKPFSV